MARDLSELVDTWLTQENIHHFEGRRGVESMCQFARALGYQDPQYWGQMTSKACLGDLVMLLEDNPGMMEAMVEWVRDRRGTEFVEALTAVTGGDEPAADHYEGGVCPDCGEEINPASTRGDECDNCGHVFNWGESDDESLPDEAAR